MYAICLKDVSPIIKKGDKLILIGDNFIKEGYNKPEIITNHNKFKRKTYKTPNYYYKELVFLKRDFFEVKA